MLEQYFVEYSAQEAERPALAKMREHIKVTFHPDSQTMKSFEHHEEEASIEVQPVTEFDEDAALPFAGLDAPFGG